MSRAEIFGKGLWETFYTIQGLEDTLPPKVFQNAFHGMSVAKRAKK